MTRDTRDRLYELLPYIYRQRDQAEHGEVLRALLRVISEQVDVVEDDIAQLYENWFIETAEDWVVPYLADLIGYEPVQAAGRAGDVHTAQGQALNRALTPRREVTNTVRYRRRKGTLALLELLARDVAAWPARAVEFFPLLAVAPHVNHLRLDSAPPPPWHLARPARWRAADMRDGSALDRIGGPFDTLAHGVDVRRINSRFIRGRHNLPNVGLFVWRLKPYSITRAPGYCTEKRGYIDYTFSILGNDAPLCTRPQAETDPQQIAAALNVPAPIRRRAFEDDPAAYYGEDKSLFIWVGDPRSPATPVPVPLENIVAADLSGWRYKPEGDQVAVDPQLGRITFSRAPKNVWVSYHYAFSDDMGGGEYPRALIEPAVFTLYRVGAAQTIRTIAQAIAQWSADRPQHAIIELTDSGAYWPEINLSLDPGQTLQIRARSGARPTLRLGDRSVGPDGLFFALAPGSRLLFDGLLITGRGIQVQPYVNAEGQTESDDDNPAVLTLRHCTLVPGWALEANCEPKQPGGASIFIDNVAVRITIDHSITGPVHVNRDAVRTDPQAICIRDSIIDAMRDDFPAIASQVGRAAHAALTIARSTIIGTVYADTLHLAENSIFTGRVTIRRRQIGCVRYSYVEHGSCIPRRFQAQPDGVVRAVDDALAQKVADGLMTQAEAGAAREALRQSERVRVRPRFTSMRYGHPGYGQLAEDCAVEITRGAEDESEMGAFHDLYQPQRAANLSARLAEYMPAGMDAGIIYAS